MAALATVNELVAFRDMVCDGIKRVYEFESFLGSTAKSLDKYSASELAALARDINRQIDELSALEHQVFQQFEDPIRTALEVGNARAGMVPFQDPDPRNDVTTYTGDGIGSYLSPMSYAGLWYAASEALLRDYGIEEWPDWLSKCPKGRSAEARRECVELLEGLLESRRYYGETVAKIRAEFAQAIAALPAPQQQTPPIEGEAAGNEDAATALPQWKPRQPKSWADVIISEHDHADKVRVRIGGKSCVVTAGELRMVHAQNGNPSESFRFLRELLVAQDHSIDPQGFRITPVSLRKKVARLNNALRKAFGVDANAVENSQTVARRYRKQQPNKPIPQDMQGGQYFIAFRLESDSTR